MAKFFNTRTLTAGAFIAVAAFSILSLGSSAQASTNVLNCTGPSAGKVIDCCQKVTRSDRPLWMRDSGSSCHNIVVCHSKYSRSKRCYVRIVRLDRESRDTPQPKGNDNRRNNNIN